MIDDTLEKSRLASLTLRKKSAPARFSELAEQLELRFRKTSAMENLASLRLRDRLYSGPIIGYLAKLVVSIVRLPVRLKQIYQGMESLKKTHQQMSGDVTYLKNLYGTVESSQLKYEATLVSIQQLQTMNHEVLVKSDALKSELREKMTRCMEEVSALESRIKTSSVLSGTPSSTQPATGHEISSAFYAAFERRFRNLDSEQHRHFTSYLPFLRAKFQQGSEQLAIDLGCGRGEWLKILSAEGFKAIGVDKNSTTNNSSRTDAEPIVDSDALEFLQKADAASFSIVSSFHLIEHVDPGYLLKLVQEAYRTLKPGGLLILETPNPENLMVGACNFYMDPTHKKPIPPSALAFMTDYFGFDLVDCLRFHPWLAPYEGNDAYLQKISNCFAVGQDYAIIAQKPVEAKIS